MASEALSLQRRAVRQIIKYISIVGWQAFGDERVEERPESTVQTMGKSEKRKQNYRQTLCKCYECRACLLLTSCSSRALYKTVSYKL